MSMIFNLMQVPDETIHSLLHDPPSITEFLYPEVQPAAKKPGFWGRIFGSVRAEQVSKVEVIAGNLSKGLETDLDKSWHGLHFLFTGSEWEGEPPENFLLNWGTEVGKTDVGYGPARTLTAAQTMEVGKFLASTNEEEISRRYDPQQMTELCIYPDIWEEEQAEALEYLMEYFRALRQFIRDTCENKSGLLTYMN